MGVWAVVLAKAAGPETSTRVEMLPHDLIVLSVGAQQTCVLTVPCVFRITLCGLPHLVFLSQDINRNDTTMHLDCLFPQSMRVERDEAAWKGRVFCILEVVRQEGAGEIGLLCRL